MYKAKLLQHLWREFGIDDEKFASLTNDQITMLMIPEEKE